MTHHPSPRADMLPNLDAISTIELPLDWSPEQALAVFEILGALREHLWIHYGMDIQHALRSQQSIPEAHVPSNIDDPDVPF